MKRPSVVRRIVAWSLIASISLGSFSAFAQPHKGGTPTKAQIDEARTHREKGMQLYKEGAFEAALVELERAYDLAPTYKLLYNIAVIHNQLNDFAAALRTYERYIAEGGGDIPAAKKQEAEKEMATLKLRVGTVNVTTVEGAEVYVDDVSQGKAPLTTIVVNPGKRKISASKDGYTSSTKVVTVAGNENAKVVLDLTSTTPTPTPILTEKPPIAEKPKPKSDDGGPKLATIGWGVTAALAVGAGVTGFLALRASSNLKTERDSPTATRESLDGAQGKVRTYSILTDVLVVGAVAVGSLSLYFTLKGDEKRPTATARVGLTPCGVVLLGDF